MFSKKKPYRKVLNLPLNITSLMDILTIILIFLIQSFSDQQDEVTPPKDFVLPASTSERTVKLAVKVSVSPDEVRVEDKVVLKLIGGSFRSGDLNRSRHIVSVLNELRKQKARLQSGARTQAPGEEDEAEIVYFEAASGTKYETIDRLLKTAAAAGFTKFRLAVHRKA